ncbi:CPBP family intramembrane glutamic endopeptidase [Ureibacillus sp. 179-F W5.1 NHS]|uniref:lysostaphin resistance A-like protein n=1 Tax=Ureibacillus sp. 179-F W5.1 NHS TaxID=3374297 RepID=UPI003879A275
MESVPRAITSAIIKIVIWVIPVILLAKVIDKTDPFSFLGLRHNFKKSLKWIYWVFLVFILYILLNITVLDNKINLHIGFDEWLNVFLLVGITEEIVFRGFILNKLMDSFRFWIANTITSLLFVLIHFPIWIYKGLFAFHYILSSSITIFVLGALFGYVYKKTSSLWLVIIIHSFYNLLVLIFH